MKKILTAAIMLASLTIAASANASFIVSEYNNISTFTALSNALANNTTPSSVTTANVIDFKNSTGANGVFSVDNPFPNNQTVKFGLDIKTNLNIGATGNYYFRTLSDDGVKLFIDGAAIITRTNDHAPLTDTSLVEFLTSGLHSLEVQFYQNGGGATLELSSSSNRNGPYQLVGAANGLQATVPEPTTVALLGLGLLGFAASRRKSIK